MARKNAKLQESLDKISFEDFDIRKHKKKRSYSTGRSWGMRVGNTPESIAKFGVPVDKHSHE